MTNGITHTRPRLATTSSKARLLAALAAACTVILLAMLAFSASVASPNALAAQTDAATAQTSGERDAGQSGGSEGSGGTGGTEVSSSIDDEGLGYAVIEGVPFGLSGFYRMQTGQNKTYNGDYEGYLYAIGQGPEKRIALTLLGTDDKVILYVPQETAEAAGLDLGSKEDTDKLVAMVKDLDDQLANGGVQISKADLPFVFTTDEEYVDGENTYRFDFQLEQNRFYAGVKVEGAESSRGVTKFCETCALLPADQVGVAAEGSWFQETAEFLGGMDYRPLWVSLKTSLVAMVFIFILGIIAAWRSLYVRSRWKSILDSIFTIPMVLPPTVCGFLLLVIFGKSSAFGQFLIDHGISLVFTWPAAVIAAVVVGFPLMYRTVLGAFEALDMDMLNAARTLGWSETSIFRKLMLPLAWPSIAAGTVLAFARAMGEFGCTLFFAGNFAGVTQTMPIAIYFSWMGGSTDVAVFWVVVIILFSFLVITFINLWSQRTTKYNRREVVEE